MTDFHSLLLNRRSIRKYQDKDLSAEDVKLLLEAALLAPHPRTSVRGRLRW